MTSNRAHQPPMGRARAGTTFAREIWFRFTNRIYGPGTKTRPWTWIGDERIAIGSIRFDECPQCDAVADCGQARRPGLAQWQ